MIHNAGGYTSSPGIYHNDILEFNAEDGTWVKVGSMLLTRVGSMVISRGQHAVSVINYLEIADYCN